LSLLSFALLPPPSTTPSLVATLPTVIKKHFTSKKKLTPGELVKVKINEAVDYDLVGYTVG